MRKTTQSVRVADLRTVRIVCLRNKCGGVVEMPLEKVSQFESARCPVCLQDFNAPERTSGHSLEKLRSAIAEVKAMPERLTVEFVIHDENSEAN